MKRKNQKKSKIDLIGRILILIGVISALVAGILGWRLYQQYKQREKLASEYTPLGDSDSDEYEWEGEYIETGDLAATLSIERRFPGHTYDATVTWTDVDGEELSVWKMTAIYDAKLRILSYNNCSRTDMAKDNGKAKGADKLSSNVVYRNTSGYFYLKKVKKKEYVLWKDGSEDFGEGMVFEKNNESGE